MHSIYIWARWPSIGVGSIGGALRSAPSFLGNDREVTDLAPDAQDLTIDHRPCSRFDHPGKLTVLAALQGNSPAVALISLDGVGGKDAKSDRRRRLKRVGSLGQDYAVRVGIDGIDRVEQQPQAGISCHSTDLEC